MFDLISIKVMLLYTHTVFVIDKLMKGKPMVQMLEGKIFQILQMTSIKFSNVMVVLKAYELYMQYHQDP